MTINDLTINFNHLDAETLLSDWQWLIGDHRLPIMITAVGDAFVQDRNSMEVFFLDAVNGQLEEVAENGAAFEALLSEVDFVMEKFSVNLIAPLIKEHPLPSGNLYGWKKPPILGGEYSNDNLEATDIEVHFSITGQILNKVTNLPEGTEIGDIQFQ